MKKVLVISYFFPPRPSVASVRLGGLAKYLRHYGWEPVILTAKLPGKPDLDCEIIESEYPGDVSSLIKQKLGIEDTRRLDEGLGLPVSLRESKNPVLNGILNFCYGVLIFPEEHKLWHKYGVREGLRYLQGAKIDAILSSSSPITSHLIANSLKKKFPRPWLADLRDLWTQNHYYLFGPLFKFIERNIELNTLSRADLLVTVSRPLATRLSTLHSSKTCQSIPNGFDPDDYKFSSQPLDEKFSIVYTGGLLQGKRDPDSLLNAVRELLDENKLSAEDLQIKFFGRDQYWLQKDIAKNRLGGIAVQCPQLPRQEIQQTQRRAQLLLLLNWNDPREVGVYTGKVFEYLAARRPILAVGGPQGVISELMTATHAGNHVREKDEIKRTLLKHYEEYKKTGAVSYNGREDEVMKFSHKQMAMKFAQALNQLTQSDVVLA